jgi:ABC-type sugar transport system ATPase subunit
MNDYILEMMDITKDFPGVRALDSVNFKVRRGEIHALVGENGAGKSTLMKVLSGVFPHGNYEGSIVLNGEEQRFQSIRDSECAGIAIIYQELALVQELDICENIFLGNEISDRGFIHWDKAYSMTKDALSKVNLGNLNPTTTIINLGVGKQQLIEIAKAIIKNIDILILDEPSAALSESEVENLFSILRDLKKDGVTCIYISHRLEEVFEIADTVTVLRDGQTIDTQPVKNIDNTQLISMMVGRKLTQMFPRKEHKPGEAVLELKNWSVYSPELPDKKVLKDINLRIRRGEILGISGLMGSGRTELAMSIVGAYGIKRQGDIVLEGKKVRISSPLDAIKYGISCLSEDRKNEGLVMGMDIGKNISLASHRKISSHGVIDKNAEIQASESFISMLRIKCSSIEQEVRNLSGGNQQKVVLAKWLMTAPKVLILDEPTRGIDVGAKVEIYNIMNRLVEEGVCVVMISSELPEILGMSDRVVVMSEGRITGDFDWRVATQERILEYSIGGREYTYDGAK